MKLLTLILCLLAQQALGQAFSFRDTPFLIKTFTATTAGNNAVFNNVTHVWHLHESAGNSRVDSKGSSTLTENGGAIPNASGINGNCADFSSSPSKFLANSLAAFSAPMSISVWVKAVSMTADGNDRSVWSKDDGSGEPAFLKLSRQPAASTFSGSATVGLDFDTSIMSGASLTTWHLIVLTLDSGGNPSQYNQYLDGIAVDGSQMGPVQASGTFKIGQDSSSFLDAFQGLIAEVIIWNVELTADNVTTLWASGSGSFYSP